MFEVGNIISVFFIGINFILNSIVVVVFVGILILVILFGNVFVCISFYIFFNFRMICNYFIVSLSVVDILVVLFVMLFWFIV